MSEEDMKCEDVERDGFDDNELNTIKAVLTVMGHLNTTQKMRILVYLKDRAMYEGQSMGLGGLGVLASRPPSQNPT